MKIYGIPRKSKENQETPWKSKKMHGNPCEPRQYIIAISITAIGLIHITVLAKDSELPCMSMQMHGNLCNSMEVHANPWQTMSIHENRWDSRGNHGKPRKSMEIQENAWKSMRTQAMQYIIAISIIAIGLIHITVLAIGFTAIMHVHANAWESM